MTLKKSKSQTQSSSLSFSVLICLDSRCPGGFSSNCAVLCSLAASLFSCCSCYSSLSFLTFSISRKSFGIDSLSSFLGCCHCRFFSHFTIKNFSFNDLLTIKICLWTTFLNTCVLVVIYIPCVPVVICVPEYQSVISPWVSRSLFIFPLSRSSFVSRSVISLWVFFFLVFFSFLHFFFFQFSFSSLFFSFTMKYISPNLCFFN